MSEDSGEKPAPSFEERLKSARSRQGLDAPSPLSAGNDANTICLSTQLTWNDTADAEPAVTVTVCVSLGDTVQFDPTDASTT